MGLIANAFGSFIAGLILYRFLCRQPSEDKHNTSQRVNVTANDHFPENLLAPNLATPPKPHDPESPPRPSVTLNSPSLVVSESDQQVPPIEVVALEEEDKDGGRMPSIPIVMSSLQPAPSPSPSITSTKSPSPPRLKPPTFGAMSAPPRPGNIALRPPPSAASSLRVPPQKAFPNTSMAPTSSIMPPGKQVSRKVILEPGHSPLDWAALTNNPNSRLRGKDAPENLIRVTPEQLKIQNGRKGRDVWTVYHGKVYNITPYIPFHPGGKGEILRGAGKDSVKLFMEVHPWVNWDGMLSECLVGILVGDEDVGSNESTLDEMD